MIRKKKLIEPILSVGQKGSSVVGKILPPPPAPAHIPIKMIKKIIKSYSNNNIS